eukprot:5160335-Lingulodinium_polyedra.AAC.1
MESICISDVRVHVNAAGIARASFFFPRVGPPGHPARVSPGPRRPVFSGWISAINNCPFEGQRVFPQLISKVFAV